jgi:hypothetical protein
MIIELRKEPFELWSSLIQEQAFDQDGHLDMDIFRALGGRLNDLQGLVNVGALERMGPDFYRKPNAMVVEWIEKVFDAGLNEDDETPSRVTTPSSKKGILPVRREMPTKRDINERMPSLSIEQLVLLGICFRYTNWERGRATTSYRIRVADLCATNPNFTSQDVVDLLGVLGIPVACHNHTFPGYMKGAKILSDGTLKFQL